MFLELLSFRRLVHVTPSDILLVPPAVHVGQDDRLQHILGTVLVRVSVQALVVGSTHANNNIAGRIIPFLIARTRFLG